MVSTPPRAIASFGIPNTTQVFLVLRQRVRAGALHFEHSSGAVVAHAGHDDCRARWPRSEEPPTERARRRTDDDGETSGPVLDRDVVFARRCRCRSIWRLPGAISTRPGKTLSPSSASFTSTWQSLSRRRANAAVKSSGMCWTTTMPGQFGGQRLQDLAQGLGASGRRADANDLLRRSGHRSRRDRRGHHHVGGKLLFYEPAAGTRTRAPTWRERAAALIASQMLTCASSRNCAGADFRLEDEIDRPRPRGPREPYPIPSRRASSTRS